MFFTSARILTGRPSLFLNALRLLASLTVLIVHANTIWNPIYEHASFPIKISHGAVVIFFVLSGFVIAHITASNNRGAKQYVIAKLSRLCSIFYPAILLTCACSVLVFYIDFPLFERYSRGSSITHYFMSFIFINEVWFFSSAPSINTSIWSLSYEFWYYLIFGCSFYKKAQIWSFLSPLIVCLIAGPKILLMIVMWLAGWCAYHLRRTNTGSLNWALTTLLVIGSFISVLYLPSLPFKIGNSPLFWASQFFTDWIAGLFVASALYFLPNGSPVRIEETRRVQIFRKIADLTFPIYVLHYPLLILAKSILSKTFTNETLQFYIGFGGVLSFCVVAELFLERKRFLWIQFFSQIIYKFNDAFYKLKLQKAKYL